MRLNGFCLLRLGCPRATDIFPRASRAWLIVETVMSFTPHTRVRIFVEILKPRFENVMAGYIQGNAEYMVCVKV